LQQQSFVFVPVSHTFATCLWKLSNHNYKSFSLTTQYFQTPIVVTTRISTQSPGAATWLSYTHATAMVVQWVSCSHRIHVQVVARYVAVIITSTMSTMVEEGVWWCLNVQWLSSWIVSIEGVFWKVFMYVIEFIRLF
jgi:hypothetical protein